MRVNNDNKFLGLLIVLTLLSKPPVRGGLTDHIMKNTY